MALLAQLIARRVRALPALSSAVGRLCAVVDDPNSDVRSVASAVRIDPGLAANVLRAANGASFGLKHRVDTLDHAISILGRKKMQRIAVGLAAAAILPEDLPGYDIAAADFGLHAVATGMLAERLAEDLELQLEGDAFTAGLLHDIGKLALGVFVAENAELIHELAFADGGTQADAERRVLGTDHARVGEMLAKRWKLPKGVQASIRWVNEPRQSPKPYSSLVALVHVADRLAMEMGFGLDSGGMQTELDSEAARELGVDSKAVQRAVASCHCEIMQLSAMLQAA